MKSIILRLGCIFFHFATLTPAFTQITVVNMIPHARSDETANDAEPTLAVNPAKPWNMAASAFTSGLYGFAQAPIFVSTDGGNTWDLNYILPDNNWSTGTADITIQFGGNGQHLYCAMIDGLASGSEFRIFDIPDFLNTAPVSPIPGTGRGDVDQPYLQASTALGGAERRHDKVFIGNYNHFKIGTIDFCATDPSSGFTSTAMMTSAMDTKLTEPAVRPAVHASGTVYAIYYKLNANGWNSSGIDNADVVVVRDNNWGNGTAFQDLGGQAGSTVASNRTITVRSSSGNSLLGNNRLVGSNLAIAVDPNNAGTVYVAWADNDPITRQYTLHVRSSTNSGVSWSAADLRTIANATNPAIAVNTNGKVAFLYQQITGSGSGQRWETHLQRSSDLGLTWPQDDILCRCPLMPASATRDIYLGDYLNLIAVGKDFCGIFSASNFPDLNDFPHGAPIYQRAHNFDSNVRELYTDDSRRHLVDPSIDPFFFHVTELPSEQDFYVRDFTNSATDFDNGAEPSIDPRFCVTSDVWNMRSNGDPNLNCTDPPPDGEDPQQTTDGSNFAYVRVYRKRIGPATDVNVHFLFSEFGLGNNFARYTAAGARDVTLSFNGTDLCKTLTSGYSWELPAHHSTHNCLAVEISAPGDAIVQPPLLGHVPGWSNGTDLMIFNDNNKAQRNMGLYEAPASGPMPVPGASSGASMGTTTIYALVHNPTLEIADLHLTPVINPIATVKPTVSVIGSSTENKVDTKGNITLRGMKPGESRFLRIKYAVPKNQRGKHFSLTFNQVKNGIVVNAFTILQKYDSIEKVIGTNLKYDATVFGRVNALYMIDTAKLIRDNDSIGIGNNLSSTGYVSHLKTNIPFMRSVTHRLVSFKTTDPFQLTAALAAMQQQVNSKNAVKTVTAHLALLNAIDACLTSLQLEKGNAADILQTIYLQRDILQRINSSQHGNSLAHVIDLSTAFVQQFESRQLMEADYPTKVMAMLGDLRVCAANFAHNDSHLLNYLDSMVQTTDPTELQGLHIKFLLLLKKLTNT
jgi:hypothetical protein